MKILMVDDNPEFLKYTSEILEDHGHLVDIIDDATVAFEKVRHKVDYDVVIFDIMMMRIGNQPKDDPHHETGVVLYTALRSANPIIPVVIFTAIGKAEIWSHFRDDPNTRYFAKPILSDVRDFLVAVEKWN